MFMKDLIIYAVVIFSLGLLWVSQRDRLRANNELQMRCVNVEWTEDCGQGGDY